MSARGSVFLRCAGSGCPKDVGCLHAGWIRGGDWDEHTQSDLTRQKKCKLRRKLAKVRRKHHDAETRSLQFVKHAPYAIAHHLCQHHEQIIMPDFSRSNVVQGN